MKKEATIKIGEETYSMPLPKFGEIVIKFNNGDLVLMEHKETIKPTILNKK